VEAALRHVHPRWIGVTPSASISQPLLVHTRLRKRVGLGPAGRGRRNARADGASELPAQTGGSAARVAGRTDPTAAGPARDCRSSAASTPPQGPARPPGGPHARHCPHTTPSRPASVQGGRRPLRHVRRAGLRCRPARAA
jgi:hypothetical protein